MPSIRLLNLSGNQPVDIVLSESGAIGRDATARYQVADVTVSRSHALLTLNNDQVVLSDLGSANGTFLNGKRLEKPTTLKDGDDLLFGKIAGVFYVARAPAALPTEMAHIPAQRFQVPPTSSANLVFPREKAEQTSDFDASRERITHEDLQLAARAQKRNIPKSPNIPGYHVAVQWIPHYIVGGDFIDVRQVDKNEWAFVLGDVSGKGISAAMYMMQVVAACRILLPGAKSPAAFLKAANQALQPGFETGVFATAVAIFINTDKGLARIALAGHAAPVLRTKAGKMVDLQQDPGVPLCAQDQMEPSEQRVQLALGDALIVHTDGVDEAEPTEANLVNVSRVFFGMEKRDRALQGRSGAENLAIGLREAVYTYRGETRSSDDLAIMVIERLAP